MKIRKLFISIPMAGRDPNDIRSNMMAIKSIVESEFNEYFELIDTVFEETPDPNEVVNDGTWYLGKSIKALSKADIAAFDSNWSSARGCIIEHMICALYKIPYVDLAMDYISDDDDSDVNDYTHDWDIAGEVNNLLSEELEDVTGYSEDLNESVGIEKDDIYKSLDRVDRKIKISELLNRRRNKNVKHSEQRGNEASMIFVDEIDAEDELEPGEYDADAYFKHSGVKGQKWGIRRYQNPDGSLTILGREHYGYKGPESTVFISGSSKTQFEDSGYYRKELPEPVKNLIDDEIKKNSHIIVGDAPGIDRQVQDYLKKSKYDNVEIFGPGHDEVRYKADDKWKSTTVDNPDAEPGSKDWLAAKDFVMSDIADRGIAVVLDEGAKATRKNVDRLMSDNKDVYVYELSKNGDTYDRHI